MTENNAERVRAWLEKSGHPFEWRTAEAFRRVGFDHVEVGRPYVDPRTTEVREADVTALSVSGALSCLLHSYFVVECKAATQPWALFMDDTSHLSLSGIWAAMFRAEFGELEDLDLELLAKQGPLLRRPLELAYGMRGLKEGGKAADLSHTALMEVSSAARGILSDMSPVDAKRHRAGARVVAHAVIVTTAPLIACRLDQQGRVACSEIKRAGVLHRPHADQGFRLVHVVNEDVLEPFIQDCKDTGVAAEREVKARLALG